MKIFSLQTISILWDIPFLTEVLHQCMNDTFIFTNDFVTTNIFLKSDIVMRHKCIPSLQSLKVFKSKWPLRYILGFICS